MKYLHTMVRVSDVDASVDFYCNKLGLDQLHRMDNEAGRFSLIFLAAPGNDEAQVELTHNWDTESYILGDAYGHIALGVDDIYNTCAGIADKGGRVVREPGPMKHGTTVIAFVEDPDGYKVELIELSSKVHA